jgi:hypothetical protein
LRRRSTSLHFDERFPAGLRKRQHTTTDCAMLCERAAVVHSLAHVDSKQGHRARSRSQRENLLVLHRCAVDDSLRVLSRLPVYNKKMA